MMELVKLVLIVLLTNVFCHEMDVDHWTEGIEGDKWLNSEVIEDALVRMTRKPGRRQYLRFVGKKDSKAKAQATNKQHRFKTFVGLMGKRSFEDKGDQ